MNTSSANWSEPVQEMNSTWCPSLANASAMFLPTPPTDLLVVPLKVLPFNYAWFFGGYNCIVVSKIEDIKWKDERKLMNKPLKCCCLISVPFSAPTTEQKGEMVKSSNGMEAVVKRLHLNSFQIMCFKVVIVSYPPFLYIFFHPRKILDSKVEKKICIWVRKDFVECLMRHKQKRFQRHYN